MGREIPAETRKLLMELAQDPESYRVDEGRPDPIILARESEDDRFGLITALFAYGNVKQILRFLKGFNWEECLAGGPLPEGLNYRFQHPEDVREFCKTIRQLAPGELKELFLEGYRREENPIDGLRTILTHLYRLNPYQSEGYNMLLGQIPPIGETKRVSPYKRWNMFFRWMVRTGAPDLGRWREVNPARLIIPLDTHTQRVGYQLGLVKRRSSDLATAIELTEALRELDPGDPLKFEFILYRIGQGYLKGKSTPKSPTGRLNRKL
ncbi:MAG: TIGR02757 family protein [Campylobacterales bacterium]